MHELDRIRLTPFEVPSLEASTVHIWWASLDRPDSFVVLLRGVLDGQEHGRASTFPSERDTRDYVVGRGILRTILGGYLGVRPEEVRLGSNPYGKPVMAGKCGKGPAVRFSLSHSGRLVLYAFTIGREIGVDLEYMSRKRDIDVIAETYFSLREYAQYRTLPRKQRRAAFFRCWTRREAYIKARGLGFSIPPDHFDVSLLPNEPAALLRACEDPRGPAGWAIRDIPTRRGYRAALAVEEGGCRILLRDMGPLEISRWLPR